MANTLPPQDFSDSPPVCGAACSVSGNGSHQDDYPTSPAVPSPDGGSVEGDQLKDDHVTPGTTASCTSSRSADTSHRTEALAALIQPDIQHAGLALMHVEEDADSDDDISESDNESEDDEVILDSCEGGSKVDLFVTFDPGERGFAAAATINSENDTAEQQGKHLRTWTESFDPGEREADGTRTFDVFNDNAENDTAEQQRCSIPSRPPGVQSVLQTDKPPGVQSVPSKPPGVQSVPPSFPSQPPGLQSVLSSPPGVQSVPSGPPGVQWPFLELSVPYGHWDASDGSSGMTAVPKAVRSKKQTQQKVWPKATPESGREFTTVMLDGAPEDLSRETLIDLLDQQGFTAKYDFVYLPAEFKSWTCIGYMFVNLVAASDARALKDQFQGLSWPGGSGNICNAKWCDHQGLSVLVERFRNSTVMHETVPDVWKPVVYQDGAVVEFPPPTKVISPPTKVTQTPRCTSRLHRQ